MKVMQFLTQTEGGLSALMEDFQNQYLLVFDLTSLQDAAEQLHHPELSGKSLRLGKFFQFLLEQSTEVIVLGERLSNVQFEKSDQLLKLINFLSFQVLIKVSRFFGTFFYYCLCISVFQT